MSTAPRTDALNGRSMLDGVSVGTVRGREARPVLVLISLMLVIASFQLNATMLSPAVNDMAQRLDTNAGVIGWSSTVFLAVAAALAILVPPLADKVGRRTALIGSVAIMIVGTLIVLFTADPMLLMIGRGLQGFCGATFALSNLTLRAMLEPRRYALYIALVAAVNSGIGGVDTLIGGILVDTTGYKGIIVVILVVEVIALLFVAMAVPETKVLAAQRMDWGGALTLTGTLWSFNMVMTFGFGEFGWLSIWTLSFIVIGVLCAIAFFLIERVHPAPLLPISELKQRQTWGLAATTFFTLASAFSVLLYLIPAIATDNAAGFGLGGTTSALLFLMPFSLLGWAAAPFVGYFAPRVGYRLVLRVGLIGSAVLIMLMFVGINHLWMLVVLSTLMGATYAGISNTVLNTLGVLYASEKRPGVLPGLTSAAFNLGAAVGTGIMASIVAANIAAGTPEAGHAASLTVALVSAILALLFSFALPRRVREDEII